MRYELSDYEWTAIKSMLPNKPRGVRRVNDRRVLNGIFWVLRSGAPWRDLPETYGPPISPASIGSNNIEIVIRDLQNREHFDAGIQTLTDAIAERSGRTKKSANAH
jgi:transposase